MPVTEQDVGITERISSHNPFRAVLKQNVGDFLVNEIRTDGTVASLTQPPRFFPKPKRSRSPEPDVTASLSKLPSDELDSFFPAAKSSPSAALLEALSKDDQSHILPVQNDKFVRKSVHTWIRQNLPGIVTDTLEIDKGQAIRLRRRSDTRPWKRRRREKNCDPRKNSDALKEFTYDPRENRKDEHSKIGRNTLVNFILWKKNRDTLEALTKLSRAIGRNIKDFSYAGTKDKRATTTQAVQIRGAQENQLAEANLKLMHQDRGNPSILIGNVSTAGDTRAATIRLGDLKGNRFSLVLRDLETKADSDIQSALTSITQIGFINYFGLQRFGSGVSPTHVTGFAALRGDYKEVCRRILLPLRIGSDGEEMRPQRKRFVLALEQFAKQEITAVQLLPALAPWQRIENAIVESFAGDEKKGLPVYDYKKAFGKLPRFLRMMYGHAVQSYLWNIMASERIRETKPSPSNMHAIAGDLVLQDGEAGEDLSFKTGVRTVTKEEEEEKSIAAHRVFIPVLGSEVPLPQASYANVARKVLEEEHIDFATQAKSEHGMKGTYRRLIATPTDMDNKIVTYTDTDKILIPSNVQSFVKQVRRLKSESEKIHKTDGNTGKNATAVDSSVQTGEKETSNMDIKGEDRATEKPTESSNEGIDKEVVAENGKLVASEDVNSTAKDETALDAASMKKSDGSGGETDAVELNVGKDTGANVEEDRRDSETPGQSESQQKLLEGDKKVEDLGDKHAKNDEDREVKDGHTEKSGSAESEHPANSNNSKTRTPERNGQIGKASTDSTQLKKTALVMAFNLGCAEYATMLVRELTGHDSSTATQKALQESAA